MGVCNEPPTLSDLGIDDAQLVLPGDASKSILSLRMHAIGANSMPPMGKNAVDIYGVGLIDSWIESLRKCP